MKQSSLLFFATLAACASIGSTLLCYECTPTDLSGNLESCGDPFIRNHAHRRMCGPEEVCLKQITPKMSSGGQDIPSVTVRGCAPKSICRNEPTEFREYCHTCSEDNCNSTVKIIPSLNIFIVLYILKLVFL